MVKRVLSGIFLLACLFVVLLVVGDLLYIASLLLSIVGLVELYRVFGISKSRLGAVGYLFTVGYYISIYYYRVTGILLFLIGCLIFLFMFYVFSYPKFNIREVALTLLGIIYVGIMFSFVYLIREQRGTAGKYLVWLIFISSWGCDTFAYIVGMLIGKHRFLPYLSPKKSLEGCIGGVIGAALLGILYVFFVYGKIIKGDIMLGYKRVALACAVGAVISQIGDLTASAIKRDYGVKDYGDLIPGHGGILDRFDSVIFTAPCFFFMYYMY
ncbi:MAG: phosphatidate cytidylyltransferase [Lachnospiraceae bacterium]|nr:phosphatidate cytidylyltransferase [Lachnospiraceae bacterium]